MIKTVTMARNFEVKPGYTLWKGNPVRLSAFQPLCEDKVAIVLPNGDIENVPAFYINLRDAI